MGSDRNKICYDALRKVFSDGAYANVELNRALMTADEKDRPYITRLFYGVLDKSVYLDYKIACLADKKPQAAIVILLKMGMYQLEFSHAPPHAVVNGIVSLTEQIGKRGAKGFVNAMLRKTDIVRLPVKENERLSVQYSYPLWIVNLLIKEYGATFAERFLAAELPVQTHIRPNLCRLSGEEFEKKYAFMADFADKTGYYASHTTLARLSEDDYVVQSAASMLAVRGYISALIGKNDENADYGGENETSNNKKFGAGKKLKVLDLCAAPGGKSVYLKSLLPDAEVTACDIHEHRVQLIRKYAAKTGCSLQVMQNDATAYKKEFEQAFDLVICDVPCSGIGVVSSKPDILLNRKFEDIAVLAGLQRSILDVAKYYVKIGGRLCYSTCTVLPAENEKQVERFLSHNAAVERCGGGGERGDSVECASDVRTEYKACRISVGGHIGEYVTLLPQTDNTDGFFVAAFERVK